MATRRQPFDERVRRIMLAAACLSGLSALLIEVGTYSPAQAGAAPGWLRALAVSGFLGEALLGWRRERPWRFFLRRRWPLLALTLLLPLEAVVAMVFGVGWLTPLLRFLGLASPATPYVAGVQFFILGNLVINVPRLSEHLTVSRVRPVVFILVLFAVLIALGAGLLMLPRSAPPAQPFGPVDALFTSASAVCVTGLAVRETGSELTRFGQLVVMFLIQLGGLGIMSVTAVLSLLLGRGIGVRESTLLREVLQVEFASQIGRLILFIVASTVAIETVGAALLFVGFRHAVPAGADRLFAALFHAVSAFCNAGFSTFGDSLVGFADNGLVMATVSGLLILGGLGFGVVANLVAYLYGRSLRRRGARRGRLTIQTRAVVRLTLLLLVGGTLLLALLEWDRAFAARSWPTKLGLAFFQAATPRTAGFYSIDLGLLAPPSQLLLIILMFIGAAPGSTGGGIKVTTVAVLWANLRAITHGHPDARLFDRAVSVTAIRRATVVFLMGLTVATTAIFLLLLTESRPILPTAFEVFSALGTVGLSLGVTPELTTAGRLIIIMVMYVGRLGPLSLAYGLVRQSRERDVRLPEERIMIG